MSKEIPLSVRKEIRSRSGGYCEARVPGVCQNTASHIHHKKRRSQLGLHSLDNLVDLCTNCHTYAHANPKFSFEVGLLIHEWDDTSIDPEEIRYKIRGSKTKAH